MNRLEWNPDFEIGVNKIDLQHRIFVDLINEVTKTLETGGNSWERQKIIRELVKYTEFHFLSEENVASGLGYPQIANHCKRHEQLLEELNLQINSMEYGQSNIETFLGFLLDWFSDHTLIEDKKISAFLLSKTQD